MRNVRITLVLLATLLAALTMPRLPQLRRGSERDSAGASTSHNTRLTDRSTAASREAEQPSPTQTLAALPAGNAPSREILRVRVHQKFLRDRAAATNEPDPAKRQEEMLSAIAEWASTDISAAAGWFFENSATLPGDLALAALFDGGKAQPAEAVFVARALSLRHPERAADIAGSLIAALSRADEHELGVQFALEAPAAQSVPLLTAAYTEWGRQQPEEAMISALALPTSDHRRTAFRAAVSGWAKVDPKTLAEQASQFPKSEERDFALLTALRQWAARDSEAAANFLAHAAPLPNPELILED